MALKNYIFIFLSLYFGSIESSKGFPGLLTSENLGYATGFCQVSNLLPGISNSPAGSYFSVSDTIPATFPMVVINEIMADPTPVVGLPDREYIELYNLNNLPLNLKGWTLVYGTRQKILPDVSIPARGFLLITGIGGARDFLNYCKVTEVSGLTLNNSGVSLSLYDTQKRLADQVDYNPSMHNKGFDDGGYSLERIDPSRFCGPQYNWATTLSQRGGTPGAENTVKASNPDHIAPYILETNLLDNHILEIQLSESFIFSTDPAAGLRNVSPGAVVDSICNDRSNSKVRIYFHPFSIQNGINYSLIVHGLKDDCGNLMKDQYVNYGFFIPDKSDILINEVLFNPFPDGSDFVEIYNKSGHDVDLSGLYLATRDASNVLKQIYPLSQVRRYMPSDTYLAVTKSIEGLIRFYITGGDSCLLQTSRFPTLSDESGCVVLLNKNSIVIDEMNYSNEMHHPFISETEGISLERASFIVSSFQRQNWHSGAKNAGFATPGYKNSVIEIADSTKSNISIDPEVFSPNWDGINDRLNVHLNDIKPGVLVNITILDSEGRMVRKLANNLTVSGIDNILWDGLDSDFKKVQPGIYVLNISLFEPGGRLFTTRRACVITDRL